ncbi:MAG: ATP-dependent sacrificial sulfur transferase LarE [Holophagaceae bacterium]|nr:ATP-dependent sacrificial sulfur transferase LarE [Holophagaceae bacterium]
MDDALALESSLLDLLRTRVGSRRALVCFSGGVDSTLVLAASIRAGLDTLALLAVSPSLPQAERAEAHALAGEMGADLQELSTGETDLPAYRANSGDRCYHCKSTLYGAAEAEARRQNLAGVLLNGTQLDDLGDVRPGLRAASEHEVFSPLLEAGFDKEAVRRLARHWGLSNADKAAAPCLASRFPVGTEVTPERLRQVEQVEDFLRAQGLWPARARWHDSVVRLEIERDLIHRALEEPLRTELERACWRAGFRFVAVDLAGLQSGSLAKSLVAIAK